MSFETPFAIIGHRGASGLAPENTLQSFQLAHDLGVDAVELDVHLVEEELIVLHDATLERTTNGRGQLEYYTLSELRKLDAGNAQQIPLLREVFTLLPPEVGINVELKGPSTAPALSRLLQEFPGHDVLVSSFNFHELKQFRTLDQHTRLAPVFRKPHKKMLEIAADLSAWSVNIPRRMMHRPLSNLIREAGYELLVWTVNDPIEAAKFKDLGARGVFTDYPDRLTGIGLA